MPSAVYLRTWRKNNPGKNAGYVRTYELSHVRPKRSKAHNRKRTLKRKYNMTPNDWGVLFASQGYACASCRTLLPGRSWDTDHNHQTGKIRGILCHKCNVALGVIENTMLVSQLELYLEIHR